MVTPRIFISYARDDGEEFAKALREQLELAGFTLWQDRADMEGGVGWWKQITNALETVEFLVLVVTAKSINSEMVKKEWRYARQQGVCVYPVNVPLASTHPDNLLDWMRDIHLPDTAISYSSLPRWMRDSHFYDLTKEWSTFINYLNNPCDAVRVPFMAPDFEDHHVIRDELLNELKENLLDEHQQNPIALNLVLVGPGGFGKTILATQLCHQNDIQTAFDDGILWLTLGETPDIAGGLTKIYRALTNETPEYVDEEELSFQLASKLKDLDCLIVIDDVFNTAHLRPFLRGGDRCTRLITTRLSVISTDIRAEQLSVYEMSQDESVKVLANHLPEKPTHLDVLKPLAELLGEWPLLLDLAGASLSENMQLGDSLPEAIDHLREDLEEIGFTAFNRTNDDERNRAISASISVSLKYLEPLERSNYIKMAVLPEDEDIPIAVLVSLWNLNQARTRKFCQRLHSLSLINFDLKQGTVSMHDKMRDYLRETADDLATMHAELLANWPDAYNLPSEFAWHWYTYNLHFAEMDNELLTLLEDYQWLKAKLENTNVNSLIRDFRYLEDGHPLHLVKSAIRLSAHMLTRHPQEFAAQLLGRLLAYYDDDLAITRLLDGARHNPPNIALLPRNPSLNQAGDALIRRFTGHTDWVSCVEIVNDDQFISGSFDNSLRLWDLNYGTEIRQYLGHTRPVVALDITQDRRYFVSASRDRTLKLWDISTGEIVRTYKGHRKPLASVIITPDAKHIISGATDNNLIIWDLESGEPMHVIEGHTDWVNGVAVNPSGTLLASASRDQTVRLWDLTTGEAIHVFTGHTHAVNKVYFSADGQYLVSVSDDKTARIWDVANLNELSIFADHDDFVKDAALTSDGLYLVTACHDNSLKVWDITSGKKLRELYGHSQPVRSVVIARNNKMAISAADDDSLNLWIITDNQRKPLETAHSKPINSVASVPNTTQIVTASTDTTLKLWDSEAAHPLRLFEGHTDLINTVLVTPDNKHIISGGDDYTIRIWDYATGIETQMLLGHRSWINDLHISSDGTLLASSSDDNTAIIWDLTTGQPHTEIRMTYPCNAVHFMCNQSQLLIGLSDHTVRVWDFNNEKELLVFNQHTDWVTALTIQPDDCTAISGARNGELYIWDTQTGMIQQSLKGHTRAIKDIAIYNEQYILSASEDNTLRLWDIKTGKYIVRYQADAELNACTIIDAQTIAAGDSLGRLHILELHGL